MPAICPRASRLLMVAVALVLGSAQVAAAEATVERADRTASAPPQKPGHRPRVGLVLSGGGARGLTHVGVLKVLERERIPVDVIAGTSMGAIIGGLYASGMSADEIESELLKVDWARLFAPRVNRQQLSQRRKEEDFEIASGLELGYRDGELRAPQAAVSSRGLETLLRRYTLPVRHVDDFDRLPIPFRAVATDMESGEAVVLSRGDLAMAMRSSMSVPGVFPSTEVDSRVLGDGGLVNNVPIDVARSMGADVVIVVNIGTPLAGRQTLNSAIGLTAQMINILTEQNVRRSLATLTEQDILVAPDLGTLTAGDFSRTPEFIALGALQAGRQQAQLQALSVDADLHSNWRLARRVNEPAPTIIQSVRFAGSELTHPEHFKGVMLSQPGELFDPRRAARDAYNLAATGDYLRVDYHLHRSPEGPGDVLEFEVDDKPWGPNYLRIGLDLSTNFSGYSAFNIKLSHNRHWLTPQGTEWRNRLQIGEVPLFYTELYHPINRKLGLSSDWFVSTYAGAQRRTQTLFHPSTTQELGHIRRNEARIGLDIGQPWSNLGELRLGLSQTFQRTEPLLLSADYTGSLSATDWQESTVRGRVVVDQLDFANFPQQGYRFTGDLQYGWRGHTSRQRQVRLEIEAQTAYTQGPHTLSLHGLIQAADDPDGALGGAYQLGGFQRLAGYRPGQLAGNAVLLTRLGWYYRLAQPPVFARGFFLGASLDLGNAWADRHAVRLQGMRSGASVYLGADTGIGPMYLGLTWAPRGEAGLTVMVGRP